MPRDWRRSPASLLPPSPGEGGNVSDVVEFRIERVVSWGFPAAWLSWFPHAGVAGALLSPELPFRSCVVPARVGAKFSFVHQELRAFSAISLKKPAFRRREAAQHVANLLVVRGTRGARHSPRRFGDAGRTPQPRDVWRKRFRPVRPLSRVARLFGAKARPLAPTAARQATEQRRRRAIEPRPGPPDEARGRNVDRNSNACETARGAQVRSSGGRKRFRRARRSSTPECAARSGRNSLPVPSESRRAMSREIVLPRPGPERSAGAAAA